MKATITSPTVFKKNTTKPASAIPNSHKLSVLEGTTLSMLAYQDAGAGHWLITFDRHLGEQKWNTWTVYKNHIDFEAPKLQSGAGLGNSPRISDVGLALIKKFEGFRSKAYLCPARVWTIGYGSTHGVRPGQTISEAAASERLRREVQIYERAVLNLLTAEPTQNQFDAMVSLCYNIGGGAIARSSVRRFHNQRRFQEAGNAFLLWNKGGGQVLPGLVRRRREERALYLQ